MLSLMGGLWVMSGSAPLAAQTTATAVRSFIPATTVAPNQEVTVTIAAADYGIAGGVTETLPAGFTIESINPGEDNTGVALADAADGRKMVQFTLFGAPQSVSYVVKASSEVGTHTFEGTFIDDDRMSSEVGGDTVVTVSADAGPAPVDADDGLQFDVVPAKAVKGAVVSGLLNPIGTKPLEWPGADTTATLVSIGADDDDPLVGEVGDFVIKEAGSGKFRLYVENSGAPVLLLSGTQAIDVALTYDDDTTVNLTGDITAQDPLAFTPADGAYSFTIPQGISANTPIGAFVVTGDVDDEYLDGIVSGGPFQVRDSDMTLVYSGSSALEVKTYTLDLTVSGDAGMANRAIIGKVTVTVTASNLAPTAPPTFEETVSENDPSDAELVKADTEVGDASEGVDANDGDSLKYTPQGNGASVFEIDEATGMITVGSDGISASTGGPDDEDAKYTRSDSGELVDDTDEFSDITYTFRVMVSDGISANNQYISATVTVDANEPTELVAEANLPAGVTKTAAGYTFAISVPDKDVPMTLVQP